MNEYREISTEPTPELFYDEAEGILAIGQSAVDSLIESGAHPADIKPLSSILKDKTEIPPDLYEKMDVDSWENSDYLRYGRWLLGVITSDDPQARLTERIFRKAYRLGIGPCDQRIPESQRFGSFANYYQELGAERSVRRGVYSNWSFERSINYVKEIALQAEEETGKPTKAYFELMSEQNRGPSPTVLRSNTGHSLSALLDMVGYPNVYDWGYNDYIEWGVKFMVANDGRPPYFAAIQSLSKRGRGPGVATICDPGHFGGIKNYQKIVVDAYSQKVEEEQRVRRERLDRVRRDSETDAFPKKLTHASHSDDELLSNAARYWIVDRLLPDLKEALKCGCAQIKNPNNFVQAIQTQNPTISAGDIQSMGLILGVFDEVWPTDTTTEMLKAA